MKLNRILMEVPLPSDWDKEVYKPQVSFAKKIRYAQERAKKVGTGSSRVAFVIEYQGRPTVLKIAKNKKGVDQNEHEANTFGDYYVQDLGITIPMIDYDEANDPAQWIHTEFAQKIKPNQFKQFFGVDHHTLPTMIDHGTGKSRTNNYPPAWDDLMWNEDSPHHDYNNALVNLCGNYDIPSGDFGRLANWGLFKNRPVIIDLGLSNDIFKTHYS